MTNDEMRQLSTILYGNADRLRAAAAIGRMEGKLISVMSVAEESGLDYRRAQEQVARFKQANVLVLDNDHDSRRKDYRVVDISYWRAAAHLESELLELEFPL